MERFEPRFPDTAIDAGKAVGGRTDEPQDWHPAPAGSHVHSFALIAGTGRARDVVGGDSWVLVRFKDKQTGAPGRPYRYKFAGADSARKAFEDLAGMEHPGAYPMIQRPVAGVVPGFVAYTRS